VLIPKQEVIMKASLITSWFLLGLLLAPNQYPNLTPNTPTVSRPPEVEHRLPIDEPTQVTAGTPRHHIDAARVKRNADELAKLAQGIPAKVDLVSKGQLPKDLQEQLKRIEKLSKELRREVTP
jgi:hypothetical protein